jgi:hypothetical protein
LLRVERSLSAEGGNVENRSLVLGKDGQTQFWQVTRTAYDKNGRAIATSDPFLLTLNLQAYVDPTDEETTVSVAGTPPAFLRATHTVYDVLGRVVGDQRGQVCSVENPQFSMHGCSRQRFASCEYAEHSSR